MYHASRASRICTLVFSRPEGWLGNEYWALRNMRPASTSNVCVGQVASQSATGLKWSEPEVCAHTSMLGISSPCTTCPKSDEDIIVAKLQKVRHQGGSLERLNDIAKEGAITEVESEKCAVEDEDIGFPVPMSPFAGELSKEVELQRALVAEAAMKAGPAIDEHDVLFEDEWLMVVNKPRGLYSEHVFASVPSLLCSKGNTEPRLHMANRLDRDTSGVMVITKCPEAAAKLTRAFTDRQVQKTYLALCAKTRPAWNKIRIESGHGRSRYGAWRVYAKCDIGRRLPGGSTVREMVTQLEILADTDASVDNGPALSTHPAAVVVVGSQDNVRPFRSKGEENLLEGNEVVTVVRAFPETGRTHQIRLHCQYLGLSLCGDIKYGGPLVWQGVSYGSHTLHSESLALTHPITHVPLHIVAPFPKWATQAGVLPFLQKESVLSCHSSN